MTKDRTQKKGSSTPQLLPLSYHVKYLCFLRQPIEVGFRSIFAGNTIAPYSKQTFLDIIPSPPYLDVETDATNVPTLKLDIFPDSHLDP